MSPIFSSLSSRWLTTSGSGVPWTVDSDGIYNYNNGPITGISDIPTADLDLLPNNSAFMMRYSLNVSTTTRTITAAAIRNNYKLSQSALATPNFGAFSYEAGSFSQYNNGNDDHDGLAMDGNGKYVIPYNANLSRVDYSQRNNHQWAHGFGGNTSSNTVNQNWLFWNATPPSNDYYKTLIAFPASTYSVWVEPWQNTIKVGSSNYSDQFNATSTDVNITGQLGTGTSLSNTIVTMSDGINGFWIGRYSRSNAKYFEIDLTDGSVHFQETIQFSTNLSHPGGGLDTEEDPFGDQLFALNGAISYNGVNGTYNLGYNGNTGWRSWDGSFSNYGQSTNTSTQSTTQSGLDCFASIDSSNRLYFGDWGHDNGGMYNIGNDSDLGMRRTNIRLLDSSSTPSTP